MNRSTLSCTRCTHSTTSWETVGAKHQWCDTCVGTHADLGQFLAACQARGLCVRQTTPGNYAMDRAVKTRKGLLVALRRLKDELRALLQEGVTARYGPLLDWAPCLTCAELVYVDPTSAEATLIQHMNPETAAWCLQNVPC